MGLIKVINPGMPLLGYICPTCGRKELYDEELKSSPICANCGDIMKPTTIPKQKEENPEQPQAPILRQIKEKTAAKKTVPDGCRNCVFSRRSDFEFEGEKKPGFKCSKDGRTHSPGSICSHHNRRGRKPKK